MVIVELETLLFLYNKHSRQYLKKNQESAWWGVLQHSNLFLEILIGNFAYYKIEWKEKYGCDLSLMSVCENSQFLYANREY